MQIEIRLRRLLQQHNLDNRGVTKDISDDLKVHRHTIGKLYRSQAKHPSLEVLGQLCGWLERHGVPGEILPQALLGTRPSELWRAVAAPGAVTFFVGEYHQVIEKRQTARWIAQHDALAMAKVVQALSSAGGLAERRLNVRIEYVPFRFAPGSPRQGEDIRRADEKRAEALFRSMRATAVHRNPIMIGSQRANHLVELMVADTFGVRPFVRHKKPGRIVPFYLMYRDEERVVPSCFGGSKAPPGCKHAEGPGVYFLSKKGWVPCLWEGGKQDAGVIIAVRDPGTAALEMAVFGFSGAGTEALGEQLLRNPDQFWRPSVQVRQRQVGVYICRFTFDKEATDGSTGDVRTRGVDVIQLDDEIVRKHVK